jgi:mannosyltransferase
MTGLRNFAADRQGWGVPLAATGLAITLARVQLGRSFGFDEVVSAYAALGSWGAWGRWLREEPWNAFYYAVLRAWSITGHSEIASRSLSVALAALTIAPTYLLAKRWFGVLAARIAVVLLVVNAFFIAQAQDLRAYALVTLFVTWSVYQLVLAVERPSWQLRTIYAAVAILSVYAHFFAAFVVTSHFLWLLAGRRVTRAWVVTFVAIGAATVPLVPSLANHTFGNPAPITFALLAEVLRNITGGLSSPSDGLYGLVGALPVLYGVLVAWYVSNAVRRPDWVRGPEMLVLLWLGTPIIVGFALSILKFALVSRYYIVVAPALSIVAGVAINMIPRPTIRAGALALACVLAFVGLLQYYARPLDDWRGLAWHIQVVRHPTDLVIQVPWYPAHAFAYYFGRKPDSETIRVPASADEAQQLTDSIYSKGRRVWLIYWSYTSPADRERLVVFERHLSGRFSEVERMIFGTIDLTLWQPEGAA